MNNSCELCHGKMAHYSILPNTYCVQHRNWIDKCASSDCVVNIKVSSQHPDGYLICPTDGSIREAATTPIPLSVLPNHHPSYDELDPQTSVDEIKSMRKQVASGDHPIGLHTQGTGGPVVTAMRAHNRQKASEAIIKRDDAMRDPDDPNPTSSAFPQSRAGAINTEEMLPTDDPTYGDEAKGSKKEDIEMRGDGSGQWGFTKDHLRKLDVGREQLTKMEGTPAFGLVEHLPPVQLLGITNQLNNNHKVNYLNEVSNTTKDMVGWKNQASIQKEALWYMLKPRWIIRRKVHAAIRNKIHGIVSPATLKF